MNREKDLINKFLIEEDNSEDDGFDSSDESYVEDADSFKLNRSTRKHKKNFKRQVNRTVVQKDRPRVRPTRESNDDLDLEGRYMKSSD